MDIGNLKVEKQNLIEIKETTKKEKNTTDTKQGCIKINDYFTF